MVQGVGCYLHLTESLVKSMCTVNIWLVPPHRPIVFCFLKLHYRGFVACKGFFMVGFVAYAIWRSAFLSRA